ncbi:YggU family protein [Candidatus Micrarchaeota archaeon]|nr:YggU family protein [Candidatus Micrarchaeota archaeon]
MILDITVVPNSKKFLIIKKDDKIKIFLKSPPEQNKANIELIKELSKALDADVRIVSGHTSRRKRLEINITEKEWEAAIIKNL